MVARNSQNVLPAPASGGNEEQSADGKYYPIEVGSDASAMSVTLNDLQQKAFLSNFLMYRYGDWHQKILERIKRGQQP